MRETALVADVYERLLRAYGPQGWWPGGDDPFRVIVGAILTQNTAWANVEKALQRLLEADALSIEGVRRLDEDALAELVRSSGYFRSKARKLKAFVRLVDERFGGDVGALLALPQEELRQQLLECYGIGPETADAIVLYAAGKPAFVIDAYTTRIADRVGLVPSHPTYDGYARLFAESLPAEASVFGEYHALLVEHGKKCC
ncbi:MAG TPA: hypothetical protein VNL92_02675, partial [Dehalococcoidia bacterium]|nr:hypothetical protein [Dehalococcoidia bacterium]